MTPVTTTLQFNGAVYKWNSGTRVTNRVDSKTYETSFNCDSLGLCRNGFDDNDVVRLLLH